MTRSSGLGFATRQLHAGAGDADPHRSRATPIHLSAGFVFEDFDEAHARFAGAADGFSYTRVGNPTNAAAERRIADLESGAGALLVGSGQAAVAVAILSLVSAGDHILASPSIYEGTRELLRDDLSRFGVRATFVAELNDLTAWEASIRPETRVLFAESIANPKNELLDIAGVAEIAHRHGIPLIVDNTLATPYLLRPIEHGADVVVHSASKFLAGHGTVLGGFIVDGGRFAWDAAGARFPHLAVDRAADGLTRVERSGAAAFLEQARQVAMRYGPTPSPLNAFLILQGIETLSLRVQRQSATASRIAVWLEDHPAVASVDYTGLVSSPHRRLAERYLPRGQGSVFAVTVHGGRAGARAFTDALTLFTRMTHLGDTRSLVLHPASTTHVLRDEAELTAAGIGQGLLRLSIGLEDPEDLIADLDRALAAAAEAEILTRAGVK
ncbi:aminotransferase class I/II-fold pyridoxal phosphate-dependent enzyme [Microbacterium sp. 13-71-7]|jgi:O-acetylhomoserine (thiol)-lyase|uniref:O-acetylhomoserine aminocarboxypropyltransferase/cysteine synthase family protein n=1 Tax=Microbacterium sp. 13-71-7 TaxID=1970399 RepID=UPI000BD0018A|nr:aminotransferase class I/II-fold pyridoxal phosphate-dependent enzyme [Microbacterium sp. 13-71-7]OZB83149.1 MAG: O-acetylhomoserine aminocarboxypropyltransferase [Microbacterium sp. 13-71-7]